MGRNGVGKTSLLRAIVGQQPIRAGRIVWEGEDITRLPHLRAGGARHRLRAAGARDLPAAHRRGEPADRLRRAAARAAARPGRDLRAVPGARGHAGPARRRPLRRPAAAAGDRPGAGDPAAPAGAGRADRGHPAVDHQGHRARDPAAGLAAAISPSCWSSSTSSSPGDLADTYAVHGPRRDRRRRHAATRWWKRMCVVTSPSEAAAAARARMARLDMAFRARRGGTRLARLYQRAPLRVLFPRGRRARPHHRPCC